MIKELTPISMAESLEYISDDGDSGSEIRTFIKKFVKIDSEKAKQLREKLGSFNMMKLKPEYIAKIIDVLPEDSESLNKIFSDVRLDEDETKKILDAIKEFK